MSSIHRRPKLTGWYWYRSSNGKVRRPLKTKDRVEAEILRAQIDLELFNNPSSSSSVTCDQAISKFIESMRRRCTSHYINNTENRIRKMSAGVRAVRDITMQTVNNYLNTLKGPYDYNSGRCACKAWMRWCLKAGYIAKDPTEAIKKITIREKAREAFTHDEIVKVIELAQKEVLFPLIMLAIHTGMRKSELFRFTMQDVDWKNGIIEVSGKNKNIRKIPINNELMPVLMQYKDKTGRPVPLTNHKRIIKRICRKAGIQSGWHCFRHTWCTELLRNGVDLETVRDLAGHGSIAITARYLHTSPQHKFDAVNKITYNCAKISTKLAQNNSTQKPTTNLRRK